MREPPANPLRGLSAGSTLTTLRRAPGCDTARRACDVGGREDADGAARAIGTEAPSPPRPRPDCNFLHCDILRVEHAPPLQLPRLRHPTRRARSPIATSYAAHCNVLGGARGATAGDEATTPWRVARGVAQRGAGRGAARSARPACLRSALDRGSHPWIVPFPLPSSGGPAIPCPSWSAFASRYHLGRSLA